MCPLTGHWVMSSGHVWGSAEAGSSHTLLTTSNTGGKKEDLKRFYAKWQAHLRNYFPKKSITCFLLYSHPCSHLGSWWQTEPENRLMSTSSLSHLIKVASVSCIHRYFNVQVQYLFHRITWGLNNNQLNDNQNNNHCVYPCWNIH